MWIRILNTIFKAIILKSGFLSKQFDIQRDFRQFRQRDSVASYLYILCAEILAISIKQNTDIKGIFIDNAKDKISQHADNTSLVNDDSFKSLFTALEFIY